MKSNFILLFLLILALSMPQLYAREYGKIEGKVVDADTGKPLAAVEVQLYIRMHPRNCLTWKKNTSKDGFFRFTMPTNDTYFLAFRKMGYVIRPTEWEIIHSRANPRFVDLIKLKAGEKRVFNIKLKKAAILKGTLFLRDEQGTRPITLPIEGQNMIPSIRVYKRLNEHERKFYKRKWLQYANEIIDKKGNYFVHGLEIGRKFRIAFINFNFSKHFEVFDVASSDVLEMDYVFDSTSMTRLEVDVVFLDKEIRTRLYLEDESRQVLYGALRKSNGKYIIKGTEPGRYNLHIFASNEDGTSIVDDRIIDIIADETTKVTLEL